MKNGCQNQKSFLEPLAISPQEAYEIEHLTKTQSQCELWKVHRKGLVTSTKLYDVFTRQATIERDSSKSGSSLARKIVDGGDLDHYSKLPVQIEHGRVHEAEARKKYTKVMMTTHENCSIRQSGLVINEAYPFLAASPDDIRTCKCCGTSLVEYKCPYRSKEAFLEENISGIQNADGTYSLKPCHRYFYQVQGAMAATNTKVCDFVVYTLNAAMGFDGSIVLVEIAFNPTFWATVMDKVSHIYLAWVLPLIFEYIDVPKQSINTDKSLQPVINLDEYEDTNQTYVIATVKGVPLFQEDLNCLSEGGDVTDNSIGVFMRYIMEQFKGIEDLTTAESFFYLSLTQDTALSESFEENCRQASSYTTSISPKDNLVLPICAYGHWFDIIIAQGLTRLLLWTH